MIDTRTGNTRHGMENMVTLDPGSNYILPWKCISRDSEDCLRVRPHFDMSGSSYSWGHTATLGLPFIGGREQYPSEQGLFSRQSTIKPGNTMSFATFKLNELEKKDDLLCCTTSMHNQQFWFSIGTDASVYHTELNAPVYDWKISINSPLKLENRLPCPTEFTIWQKTKDGKNIGLQQGKLLSRKSAHVHAADPREPIYLSMFVQGGWIMEKVCDLVIGIF